MRPRGRPSYNLDLLNDFHALQRGTSAKFAERPGDLRYLLPDRARRVCSAWAAISTFRGIYSRTGSGRARRVWQVVCAHPASVLLRLGLPTITIGLAQGDALGGGLESLLSFNVIIAEKGAKFGFPENMFGLFPGMGAYSLLSRRIGTGLAEEMILSGRMYTAEEMKDAGLVQMLVEPGEGIAATRDYIAKSNRRHNGSRAMFEAGRAVYPLSLTELDRVVDIWADACLHVSRPRFENDAAAGECAGSLAAARSGGGVGKRGRAASLHLLSGRLPGRVGARIQGMDQTPTHFFATVFGRALYSPRHCGGRLLKNASSPSRKSWLI